MKLETPQHIKDRLAAMTRERDRRASLRRIAAADNVAGNVDKAIALASKFVQAHEGYRRKAYADAITGKQTIGHGHTLIPDASTGKLRAVKPGDIMDRTTSASLTDKRLRQDAKKMVEWWPWARYLSPGAMAALLDVAYNAGINTLSTKKSPGLHRKMNAPNANRDEVVRTELPTYRRAGGKVVEGIKSRREDAVNTFLPKKETGP